jgi:hypothetical protein
MQKKTGSGVAISPLSSVKIAAINIAAQPHSDRGVYERLFRACTEGPVVSKYRGDQAAAISSFSKSSDYFAGSLVTFVQLDKEDVWGNPRTGEAATEEELKQVVLPQNLHPKFKRHEFIFSPVNHRLVVDVTQMSPGMWSKALSAVLNKVKDRVEVDEISITVEPVKDTVRRMLKMDVSKLTIVLLRPNPDDLEDFEHEVLSRMDEMNASRETVELTARRGEYLKPDDDTVRLAEVAKSNGRVDARVRGDNGKTEPRSTISHPEVRTIPVGVNGLTRALRAGLDVLNEKLRK